MSDSKFDLVKAGHRSFVWILFSGLISGFVMAFLVLLAYRSTAQIGILNSKIVPLIETNAGLIRLNESFGKDLAIAIATRQPGDLSLWESQLISMTELENELVSQATPIMSKKGPSFKPLRKGLEELQRSILQEITAENWQNAGSIANGRPYRLAYDKYLQHLQEFSEGIALERDRILATNLREAQISGFIGLMMALLSVILFAFIALRFRRQERARTVAEAKVEEQRNIQIKSAQMAALGEMAGGIAHEINNPLTVILARAETLSKLTPENLSIERIQKLAEPICRMSLRISKIVNGMRSLSRDSSQDKMEAFSVVRLVEESLAVAEIKLKQSDVKMNLDEISIPQELSVYCRPTQIEQILINLLGNAVDAQEAVQDKWVKIRISIEGKIICLSVIDNGPGIPAEIREKILQPFFTTKGVGKGTGLGLSISKSIAEQHGGSLDLDPSLRPTIFHLRLPILELNQSKPSETLNATEPLNRRLR